MRKYLFGWRKGERGHGMGVCEERDFIEDLRSSNSTGGKKSTNTGMGFWKGAVDLEISAQSSASAYWVLLCGAEWGNYDE